VQVPMHSHPSLRAPYCLGQWRSCFDDSHWIVNINGEESGQCRSRDVLDQQMRCLMGVELQDIQLSSIMEHTVLAFEPVETQAGKRGASISTRVCIYNAATLSMLCHCWPHGW
jgi:hypothetical protein